MKHLHELNPFSKVGLQLLNFLCLEAFLLSSLPAIFHFILNWNSECMITEYNCMECYL